MLVAAGILLGSAFALSLRAAVPNLAVGAVAVVAGVLTAWLRAEHGYELRIAALITLGAAVALGLALAVVVVGFRLPAWAVGLAPRSGCTRRALSLSAGRSLLLDGGPDLRRWAWPLAGRRRPCCPWSAACSGCCRGPGRPRPLPPGRRPRPAGAAGRR